MINVGKYVNGIGFFLCIFAGLGDGGRPPTLQSCARHWLKMTDANYNKALERYEACIAMLANLTGNERREYQKSLVMNLDKTSNFFFDQTSLPTVEVVRVMRNVAKLMDFLGGRDPLIDKTKQNKNHQRPYVRKTKTTRGLESSGIRKQIILYGFYALILFQGIIILILLYRCCCSQDMAKTNECSYRKCEERMFLNEQIRHKGAVLELRDEENYSLINHQNPWEYNCSAVEHGTRRGGKRKPKDEDILTDLSSLTSSGVGSDSEFEALMKRRPLPKPRH